MKKYGVLVCVVCIILLFCACQQSDPISTKLGEFEYEQEFLPSIEDLVPAEGNTLLVIYLTPADGTDLDLDEAGEYFKSGTKVVVEEQTYDMCCLAYEKVNNKEVRCALIFEIADNGYSDTTAQPTISLILP